VQVVLKMKVDVMKKFGYLYISKVYGEPKIIVFCGFKEEDTYARALEWAFTNNMFIQPLGEQK
jgi:hypothetical protein